jgi:hypothetical protein
MHYIVGTVIHIPSSKRSVSIRPGMTSQQIREISKGPSRGDVHLEDLKPGMQYTLVRISKQDDQIVYTFSSSVGERVNLNFTSVSDAERFISGLKGESIPDYTESYKNQTD